MKVKEEISILQKIFILIIILQILLVFVLHTISFAESNISIETKLGTLTIKYPEKKLKVGDEATIDIYIGEAKVICFYAKLQYDKNVFQIEKFTKSVETLEGWDVIQAKETEKGTELMLVSDSEENIASNTLLAKIHFKVINVAESGSDFCLNTIYLSDTDYNDSVDENGNGIDEKITLNFESSSEEKPPLDPTEELYLSSEQYEIGNNDINNYEEGDEYIKEVEKETTKENFIKNLKTNGEIRILKTDGTELEENGLVENGMILEITKEEEKIELTIQLKEPESEVLYLSSEAYKIGNKDINKYENGDQYISRVEKETTKAKFIDNLDTNGNIRIIKEDGKELEENELVGTGMTLEVTKDDEKIELKIAVMGDLSGDGLVSAQDLSTMNHTILGEVTLENEYKIAADFDEVGEIIVTYLSAIKQMLTQ